MVQHTDTRTDTPRAARADRITGDLWQLSIPQTYHGIPVRDARLAGSISKGASCTLNNECCSNKCTGKTGAKTCK